MDSYEIDAIKIEKAKAMHRYRTFQKIATIVRILEIFVAAVLISWSILRSSEYVPAAVEISSAFLRRVFSLLFCPHFVFLVGNVIIITLFANSRQKSPAGELQAEERELEPVKVAGEIFAGEVQVEEREKPEVVKVHAVDETAVVPVVENREIEVTVTPAVVEKVIREVERKSYRRTKSALEEVIGEKIELRRSKTVPRGKSRNGESSMAATEARTRRRMYDVEDLSNEEFKKRVEAFIEKQQKFLREESKAVVLTS